MTKKSYLSLLIAFIAGMVVASVYFLLTGKPSDDESRLPAFESVNKESVAKEVHEAEPQTRLNKSAKLPVHNVNDSQSDPKLAPSSAQLKQQVTNLKNELAVQKAKIKRYQAKLQAPSDFEQAFLDEFDKQTRDEEWAYSTETAVKDFLLTADLAFSPELKSAQCKASVCKFELAAPDDNDAFSHTQWRELNAQLSKQAFWQQFKSSASTSSDRDFSLLLSTEYLSNSNEPN